MTFRTIELYLQWWQYRDITSVEHYHPENAEKMPLFQRLAQTWHLNVYLVSQVLLRSTLPFPEVAKVKIRQNFHLISFSIVKWWRQIAPGENATEDWESIWSATQIWTVGFKGFTVNSYTKTLTEVKVKSDSSSCKQGQIQKIHEGDAGAGRKTCQL